MTEPATQDARSARIENALTSYLELRSRDMDLWRRAGIVANLSHTSMLALVLVLRADLQSAPLRQVDVQHALRLSPAGTSSIITELEGRDLVRREPAPNDRRAFHLGAGRAAELIATQITTYDDEIRQLLAALPEDSLEAVIRLFDGMRAGVEAKYPATSVGSQV